MAAKFALVVALAALACCASAQQEEPHPLSALQSGRLLTQIEAAITLNVTYTNGTVATTYIGGQQLVINLSGAMRSPAQHYKLCCFAETARGFTYITRAGPHLIIWDCLCARRRDSGLHQRLVDKPVYCSIRPVQHRRGCCAAIWRAVHATTLCAGALHCVRLQRRHYVLPARGAVHSEQERGSEQHGQHELQVRAVHVLAALF